MNSENARSESEEEFIKITAEYRERILKLRDAQLSPYATRDAEVIRKKDYAGRDYRPPYEHDADRIIHSFAYSRLADKTQVFFWIESDLYQRRLLHVNLVAKISRYIADVLGLNVHLAEAIALGHDIGHCPFGHDGERVLSEICRKNGIGFYRHNYESVWFLSEIEMLNLSLQTLDGILCHNGEVQQARLEPDPGPLTWERLRKDMDLVLYSEDRQELVNLRAKTLEGILVRFADTISYISRDIRDAEMLKILKFDEIPEKAKRILGKSNREIIGTLIRDLIVNSYRKNMISYSDRVADALGELYEFNVERIYRHQQRDDAVTFLKKSYTGLWKKFLEDMEDMNTDSEIFKDHFLYNLGDIRVRYPSIRKLEDYPYYRFALENPKIAVRDFLAGCTDSYFLILVEKYCPECEFTPEMRYIF